MSACRMQFPVARLTLNLAPADVRKEGPAYDLPIALAILSAMGRLPGEAMEGMAAVGELSLSGSVMGVRGALSMAIAAKENGLRAIMLPASNAAEAACIEGLDILPVAHLSDAIAHLSGRKKIEPLRARPYAELLGERRMVCDFADVRGQKGAKRALEIAAAGGHNVLMIGPPGSGKTMMARCLPGILPDMTLEEALEVTRIHSAAGTLAADAGLMAERPFRAPHHTVSAVALVGGGTAVVQRYMKYEVLDPAMVEQHHTPTIHWIMMSIPTGDNPYGGATGDYGITWGMMEDGASRTDIMDSIYARMKDRIYALRYPNRLAEAALRKNSAFIVDGTFGMTEMLDDGPVRENAVSSFVLEGRAHYGAYGALTTGIWLAQLTLALAACVRDIRRRDVSGAMLYVAFFGATLFLMLWEARSRYLFGFVPVLLLLAARGAIGRKEDTL